MKLVPFWKDVGDSNHGSVAISYAAGDDVLLDAQLISYECDVNIAHVLMLLKTHLVPKHVGKALLEGLRWIQKQHAKGTYVLNPLLEDVHSNVEQTLIHRYGIEVGGYLRLAIARNDQVYTDTRMWMRDHILGLCGMLLTLIDTVTQKGAKQANTVMPGYTHLRISQPITFGHWLTAKSYHYLDDVKNILYLYDQVNICPLGIFEMAGTHAPIDRTYTAQLLGFNGPTPHSLATANERGELEAKLLFALTMLAMHIRRTMTELILFSSYEFGLVTIGSAYTTGGTAQPNLTNPDTLEVVRANMARVTSAAIETVMVMDTLPSGFNRDTQQTKSSLFATVALIEKTLPVVTGVFSTLEPDANRMEKLANANFANAPDMAIQLALKGHVSFREAYQVVKAIIKGGKITSFQEMSPQMVVNASIQALGKAIQLSADDIAFIATARASVVAHKSLGGPAPQQVKRMVKKIKKEMNAINGKLNQKKKQLQAAHVLLHSLTHPMCKAKLP